MFANSDYAIILRRLTEGLFRVGGIVVCGGTAVSWYFWTQKCVTLSTSEAEYVALADSFKKALFVRQVRRLLLSGFGLPFIKVF